MQGTAIRGESEIRVSRRKSPVANLKMKKGKTKKKKKKITLRLSG